MSLKSWWHRLWCGKWTANRLLSRKWSLTVCVVAAMIALDVAGRALEESTLSAVRDVLVAYLAVQGALDWGSGKKRKQDSQEEA